MAMLGIISGSVSTTTGSSGLRSMAATKPPDAGGQPAEVYQTDTHARGSHENGASANVAPQQRVHSPPSASIRTPDEEYKLLVVLGLLDTKLFSHIR